MSPKGGDRGGRRPLKTEGNPRKPFSCRIKASNLEWVKTMTDTDSQARLYKPDGKPVSAGELVDMALEITRRTVEQVQEVKNQSGADITRKVYEKREKADLIGEELFNCLLTPSPEVSED